jgi:MULE transposase domain/Ulp1 protease family, C-terminal catalytic domain
MGSRTTPSRNAPCIFLDEPMWSAPVELAECQFASLKGEGWLTTTFTNYLIQRCLPQDLSETLLIPSSDANTYMVQMLSKLTRTTSKASLSVRQIRKKYGHYCLAESDVILPVCLTGHFFLVCLNFDIESKPTFTNVRVYDSLRLPKDKVSDSARSSSFLRTFQAFMANFVFDEHDNNTALLEDKDLLVKSAIYGDCPQQKNDYDCGLFGVVSLMFLVNNIKLTKSSFNQAQISKLRTMLGVVMPEGPSETLPDPTKFLSPQFVFSPFPTLLETIDNDGEDPFVQFYDTYKEKKQKEDFEEKADVFATAFPLLGTTTRRMAKLVENNSVTQVSKVQKKKRTVGKKPTGKNEKKQAPKNDSAPASIPVMQSSVTGQRQIVGAWKTFPVDNVCEVIALDDVCEVTDSPSHDMRNVTVRNPSNNTVEEQSPSSTSSLMMSTGATTDTHDTNLVEGAHLVDEMTQPNTTNNLSRVPDTVFESMFLNKHSSFGTIKELDLAINEYQNMSDFRLVVRKSNRSTCYRKYQCTSHWDCQFEAHFGTSKNCSMIVLKKAIAIHTGNLKVGDETRAIDGRQLKRRCKHLLTASVLQVAQVKHEKPKPNDVRKAANNILGEECTYHQAFRAILSESNKVHAKDTDSFQLLVPYLKTYSENDPGSWVDFEVQDNHTERLFVCPSFMNESLKTVRPIISLDAAHLKSKWAGTLYIASVKSALDNLYTIAFAILSGNEDYQGWVYFLERLNAACPLLSDNHPLDRVTYKYFTFVSDRDKGLMPALANIFPRNHATSCAVHIKRNVVTKYGQNAGRDIVTISKTFSRRKEDEIFQKLEKKNKSALEYILDIPACTWRSTTWLEDESLPPRYGITSTNMSEATNNMFETARNLNWLYCVDAILNKMCERHYKLRLLSKDMSGMAPTIMQIMQMRYERCVGFTVLQYHDSESVFQITRPSILPGLPPIRHTIDLDKKTCSCGIWQEMGCPCVDATAYFRLHVELPFNSICSQHCSPFYSYASQQALLRNNFIPPIIDNLRMDGTTLPPKLTGKRQAGRPKKKRLRRRSQVIDTEMSNIVCSFCFQRGHNKRTCIDRKLATKGHNYQNHDIT